MLDFVRKAFRSGLEVILWLILILFTVGGGIIGHALSRYNDLTLAGVIIGLVIGLLIDIMGGGFVATILNIDKNISTLVYSALAYSPTHKVKLLSAVDGLGLREEPDANIKSFTKLPNGTEVQLLNTGSPVSMQDKKGEWFEVRTKDGVRGWCFSGSLEKI